MTPPPDSQPPAAPTPAPAEVDDAVPGFDPDADPGAAALRSLLQKARSQPPPPPAHDLLRGVQTRLRVRSQGKFYADGWSTRDENPRATYLITAAIMLVLIAIMYFALVPGGFERP